MSESSPDKHAPARFHTYMDAHEAHMRALRDAGYVGEDTLTLELYATTPPVWLMLGQISCKGGIVVSVTKQIVGLTDDDDPLVETSSYSYHAALRGGHSILRYDNQHAWEGHSDHHHKHVFDYATGEQIGPPEWVGRDGWPCLSEFIRELMDWHAEHYDQLADAEGFAPPEDVSMRLSMGFL